MITFRLQPAIVLLLFPAGGVLADPVAGQWDSRFFLSGVNGPVNAIAVQGAAVYIGGQFTAAGELPATNLACWNGTHWSACGSGLNGAVHTIVCRGSEVFVGGEFTTAGNVAASRAARWDGNDWSALGAGLDGTVNALAITAEGQLCAGGEFTSAGGVSAQNIACWNGAAWSALGAGVNAEDAAYVLALAVIGNELYVGGTFTMAGSVSANNIARWNGATWSALGDGVDEFGQGILGDAVAAIAVNGRNLYIAGTFTSAGGSAARNIACWNGTAWAPLGEGLDGAAYALCVQGGDLFAGGAFTSAGAWSADHVARWDGARWWPLDRGVDGPVYALAGRDGALFVGGTFTTAGDNPATNMAAWDGTNWTPLGEGLNGSVRALAVSSNALYAGGSFRSAGGVAATNVACWDGASWSALGSGVGGTANPVARLRPPPVSALALQGSTLYVAGDFASAGGQAATNIAVWDGTCWSALGPGLRAPNRLYPPPTVSTLWVNGDMVCAGGTFTSAGEVSVRNLAFWDGSAWFMLGGGTAGGAAASVQALAVLGFDFFVGGGFQFAGGTPSANLAIWRTPARLELERVGALLTLQWSALLDPAFVLQCATRLGDRWLAATNVIEDAGPQRGVVLEPSPEDRFYRLAK